MKRILLTIIAIAAVLTVGGQETDDDTESRQFTKWSIAAGPNLCSYRYNVEGADNAPDRIAPNAGFDLGGGIAYLITDAFSLRVTALGTLERVRLIQDDASSSLTSIGSDLALQIDYTLPTQHRRLHLLAGPYTHFVMYSHSSEHTVSNPYSRYIATDPRSGQPLFSLGKLNAGVALTISYLMGQHWQSEIDLKWGITDLLNTDSPGLYVKPFKASIHLAYTF